MARETVLRKRNRDGKKVCTTYRISEPAYKFTFDTCDNIEATIKNSKGLTVAVLSLNTSSITIGQKGNYNICIEGNGVGTLYAEWTQSGGDECCEELRQKITELDTLLQNIVVGTSDTGCCRELREELDALDDRVTALEQGGGGGGTPECCETLATEVENIKARLTTLETNVTTLTNRLNNQTITGGEGISVTKTGDSYTITNTSQGQGSVTLLTAEHIGQGSDNNYGIDISDDGTGGNHDYKLRVTTAFAYPQQPSLIGILNGDENSGWEIVAGENVNVNVSLVPGVSAEAYYQATISAVNTTTTLTAGDGVTITDTGTGGNHNYRIDATGGMSFPDDYMVVSKSPNIVIVARGDDGAAPNLFTYDASLAGATADNNQLIEFETGKDKIRIRNTSLPKGALTAWATSEAGIYYDASTGIISYNDGTTTKTLVKIDDGSTVVPGDVEIL